MPAYMRRTHVIEEETGMVCDEDNQQETWVPTVRRAEDETEISQTLRPRRDH